MKSGDQSALAELYDRYSSVVYAVALRVLGDTGAAAACSNWSSCAETARCSLFRPRVRGLRCERGGDCSILSRKRPHLLPPFRKKRERMGHPLNALWGSYSLCKRNLLLAAKSRFLDLGIVRD
jgi:hypothetical protein